MNVEWNPKQFWPTNNNILDTDYEQAYFKRLLRLYFLFLSILIFCDYSLLIHFDINTKSINNTWIINICQNISCSKKYSNIKQYLLNIFPCFMAYKCYNFLVYYITLYKIFIWIFNDKYRYVIYNTWVIMAASKLDPELKIVIGISWVQLLQDFYRYYTN